MRFASKCRDGGANANKFPISSCLSVPDDHNTIMAIRIEELTPSSPSDRLSPVRRLYGDYQRALAEIESGQRTHATAEPLWWEGDDCRTAVAVVDGRAVGFAMIGFDAVVDGDVDCEICEIYIAPEYRGIAVLRQLLQAAFSMMHGKAGFQVYQKNQRVARAYEFYLNKTGIPFTREAAKDRRIAVLKYRFTVQTPDEAN